MIHSVCCMGEKMGVQSCKFGSVVDLVVPRPADPKWSKELWGTNNYGKMG